MGSGKECENGSEGAGESEGEMKYTPILWGWEYVGGDFAILGPNGELICTVWHGIYPEQREEEYARLIAAAPAMYEALEAAIDAVMWMSGASDFSDDGIAHDGWLKVRPQIAEWQKVLAAARGES